MMRHAFLTLAILAAACTTAPAGEAPTAQAATALAPTDSALPTGAAPPRPADPALPALPALAKEEESLARQAQFDAAMTDAAERQKVFDAAPRRFQLDGAFSQGGLVFGQTEPGSELRLNGDKVMVGEGGRFVFGFGRDSDPSALVVVTLPDGEVERHALTIEKRDFPVQRIDGLDQSKVSGFTQEQLAKIAVDSALKKAARASSQDKADWAGGFDWPVTGRISGVFGSQRILNGEPKRPHSGLDVAAPRGTPVRAPAAGIVTLAETDMYFEGGLVLLDHGHWLESAFLHLSRLDVEPGQRVEKGDIIGAVGATGRATGPHLHWSIKWVGRLVDPRLTLGEMPVSGE